MDSLRQEKGSSSAIEKCPDNPYLGDPPNTTCGPHRSPRTQEGAPGTLHRVPGAYQAVHGGFVPQGLAPEAYPGSCQPESCQERLLAPRQRKVTNFTMCIFQNVLKSSKVYQSVPKSTFQSVPNPTNQIQDPT